MDDVARRMLVVRWGTVLLAGAIAAVLTFSLMRLIIFLYVLVPLIALGGPPAPEAARAFGGAIGTWGFPALHLLFTASGAYWVCRAAGNVLVLQGVVVGLASSAFNQLIGLYFGPVDLSELTTILALGVAAGYLVGLTTQRMLAVRETLYETSRALGAANDHQQIAGAIGEHLVDPRDGGVGLWRYVSKAFGDPPDTLELVGAWRPEHLPAYSPKEASSADEPARGLEGGTSLTLCRDDLSVAEHTLWKESGIKAALVLPLVVTGGSRVGMLMVTSRKKRLSRGAVRACETVGVQAALALENLRLIEEVRRASVLRERERMAREIHDTLAQGFTSIVMNLEAAEGAFPKDAAAVRLHHEQIARTARESLEEARRLVWALHPEALEEGSLPEALRVLAEGFSRENGAIATADVTGSPRPLPAELEVTLFRTTQEALSNVRKHAGANRAALTLSYMDGSVTLDVRDDGIGFDPDAPPERRTSASSGGYGLRAMRQRIEGVGGSLAVESEPGEGTTLVVELPLPGGQYKGGSVGWSPVRAKEAT